MLRCNIKADMKNLVILFKSSWLDNIQKFSNIQNIFASLVHDGGLNVVMVDFFKLKCSCSHKVRKIVCDTICDSLLKPVLSL